MYIRMVLQIEQWTDMATYLYFCFGFKDMTVKFLWYWTGCVPEKGNKEVLLWLYGISIIRSFREINCTHMQSHSCMKAHMMHLYTNTHPNTDTYISTTVERQSWQETIIEISMTNMVCYLVWCILTEQEECTCMHLSQDAENNWKKTAAHISTEKRYMYHSS